MSRSAQSPVFVAAWIGGVRLTRPRPMPRRNLAIAGLVVALMIPLAARAHVRWFVGPDGPQVATFEPYALSDPAVLIWTVIAVALLGIAIFLDTKLPTAPIANTKIRHDVIELMRMLAGMSFLLTAYDGALIAPHLQAQGGSGHFWSFCRRGSGSCCSATISCTMQPCWR